MRKGIGVDETYADDRSWFEDHRDQATRTRPSTVAEQVRWFAWSNGGVYLTARACRGEWFWTRDGEDVFITVTPGL
ncbi:MAG: hypothetical protein ACSLEW_11225 [Nocardioides sp.]